MATHVWLLPAGLLLGAACWPFEARAGPPPEAEPVNPSPPARVAPDVREPQPTPPSATVRPVHLLDHVAPVGSARRWLSDRGVELEAIYRGEVLSSLRGGVTTRDATAYRGMLTLGLSLDTAKLGLWEGGQAYVLFREAHGRGVSEQVGDVQVLSNLDAGSLTQLSAVWYRQSFLDERVWLRLGKQDANNTFAASIHAAQLIHSSAGFPPTIPLPSYPHPEWGAVAGLEPWDWLSLAGGVYQGEPEGNRSLGDSFARVRGPFAIGSLALTWELAGLDGRLELGGWWNGARVQRPDGRGSERGAAGPYAILDQWLWRLGSPERPRGVALFAQYGWAPPDRSPIEHYLGGGLRLRGPFPYREQDELGLAVYQARFSPDLGTAHRAETALELLYMIQATDWLTLKLDVQTIVHPGGSDEPPALVVGSRFVVRF